MNRKSERIPRSLLRGDSILTENAVLAKVLVRDLCKDFNYLQEKAEGITLFKSDI